MLGTTTASTRRPRRLGRPGVVLIIVLLAVILLASLVFHVINLGEQVNGRIALQNAADASAMAGAGWVARSFNSVAMNNLAMAQFIVSADMLDSMPMATEFTWEEETSLRDVLREQLNRGVDGEWVRLALSRLVDELDAEVVILQPMNQLLNQTGYDVAEMTNYNGPSGRGKIWQAMESLDFYNQAVMENLAPLAQTNAVRGGEVNLAGAADRLAMIAPAVPAVPWRRGSFEDFRLPVTKGILPADTDDKTRNRGPYDTLFGWREKVGGRQTGYFSGGDSRMASGGKGKVPLGTAPGADPNRKWVPTGRQPARYYATYGPFKNAMDRIGSFTDQSLFHSRFATYMGQLATSKLGYIWPQESIYTPSRPLPLIVRGYRNRFQSSPAWEIPLVKDYRYWFDGPNLRRSNPPSSYFYLEDGVNTTSDDLILRVEDQGDGRTRVTYVGRGTMNWVYDVVAPDGTIVLKGVGRGENGERMGEYDTDVPTPPNTVIDPNWVTDWNQATAIGEQEQNLPQGQKRVRETRFIAVEIKSRFPTTDPNFGSAGSWAYEYPRGGHNPRIIYVEGWVDPRLWGVPQVASYLWRDQWNYESYYDGSIGLSEVRDASGRRIPQPVYRIDDYVFAGINTGDRVPVPNPFNFSDRSALPAPTDIRHDMVGPEDASRRQYMTYLALTRIDDKARVWPSRFAGEKPYAARVALAQAQVFNNHSWDLWTQMWHAQLQPVSDYRGWLAQIESDRARLADAPAVSPEDWDSLLTYLTRLQPLAEPGLEH